MKEAKITPRLAAFRSLLRLEQGQKYANLELDSAIRRYELEGQDRAFFTRLIYGVVEKQTSLAYYIGAFSSKPLASLEQKVRLLLYLGGYQILYLSGIPDSAAVNETVNLCKTECHAGVSGFVNAILRRLSREKNSLPLPKEGTVERLSVEFSFPTEICFLLSEQYGYETARETLAAMNVPPPLCLRVNTLKTAPDALLSALGNRGINAVPSPLLPESLRIPDGTPISEFSELTEGLCFVQDEASRLCSRALDAKPGMMVIDTCACPGGKSFSLAMDMENRGKILSLDLHANKLSLVKEGAARLGISILETGVQNGAVINPSYLGIADRVLCDVPCSGLGVMAKKPDLRYKDPKEFAHLPALQLAILENGSAYLKKDGILVYSTCTLNKKENGEVVAAFLASHPDFSLKEERTLLPQEHGTDGFFFAKLVKQ